MKQNLKWKISYTLFERQILYSNSCKNRKLKVKAFFVYIIYFVYCLLFIVLSQCKVYWIHFHNVHSFIYQITLYTSYTFLIVLKIIESQPCILNNKYSFISYQKTFYIDYQTKSINQNNIFSNILYIYIP